ncbi:unnamed protein product [Heligmosomoides polygyrus]|uniref:DUF4682 domain-containing protein n=1 Tax=Heligmosomoides polygyrus TaxID=6339 RepID=A0A183GLT2_HELPZ|nr:unnamed protein product [Heligmosomoides polygyrus]
MAVASTARKTEKAVHLSARGAVDFVGGQWEDAPSEAAPELRQLQRSAGADSILEEKAPEALPILDRLLHLLTPNPSEIVEADKRARSIVIYGVAECDQDMASTCRQESTENSVAAILNALDLEVRPTEVYGLGRKMPGKNLLIKNIPEFSNVYIRKSMTLNERLKDKELRARARELNGSSPNGERIYVVYKEHSGKKSDIPGMQKEKNLLGRKT